MKLTTLQILTLLDLNGIGSKSILKIGNYLKEKNEDISGWEDIVPILADLKVKMQGEGTSDKIPISVEFLQHAEKNAQRIIKANKDLGINIISYYDDLFPENLKEAINEKGREDPPVILYYKGDFSITRMPGIAIIGTREATPDGEKAGTYLAQEFAKRGLCIISGLAVGCDTCGHKGALKADGKTIAVLAHGLDSIYPTVNKKLAQEIVEKGGLLISEYPVGVGVSRYNLVARDRLQAAMGNATLVVQTGMQGGTMHAANITLKSGKTLYTVLFHDSEVWNHEKTRGNEYLVSRGAKYIKGGDDIDLIASQIVGFRKPKTSLFDKL